MLTAGGQSPLCENHRSEVEMEDTGAGHVPRATCRGVGDTDHWAAGAGLELGWAARGQFVTNNTKYLQVHPLPPTDATLLGKCVCVLGVEQTSVIFKHSNVFIFMLTMLQRFL